MDYKKAVAEKLLEIKAVTLSPNEPYTWASGMKSPIYCDNRLTMSYPLIRDLIAEALRDLIEKNYDGVKVLAGTATAGIPHCAWTAQKMDLPMVYVRAEAKAHGKQNQVEGKMEQGDRVVVIEDLISTGGSSLKVVDVLKEAGADVLGLVAIFTYNFQDAIDKFAEKNTNFMTITDYNTLVEVALEKKYINQNEMEILKEWRKNPKTYYENISK